MATRRPQVQKAQPVDPSRQQPRLGMVLRFSADGAKSAIRQIETAGFRVASSRDFHTASAIPNDFGGADVQFFERFGIAVVRSDIDRVRPLIRKTTEDRSLNGARPERIYRALGGRSLGAAKESPTAPVPGGLIGLGSPGMRDYLLGYQEAVQHLVGRMLRETGPGAGLQMMPTEEASATWGLTATKVAASALTGAGIKIAVLDTGIDQDHPDFMGRSITRKLFATNSSEGDTHGHGTHCAGTACGPARPQSVPRYGIAHEAEIFAGKVLGDDGFGTDRSIIAGMDWALENRCDIISMSLGAAVEVGEQPSDDYELIGQVCLDSNCIVIAAAGNESKRPAIIAPVGSPANATTIMAVAALDPRQSPAGFSCGGINPGQDVDIAAPGVDVLSCIPGGGYDRWNGTSMAAPHVAGVAALIAQSDPKYRGWALWARLLQLVAPMPHSSRDVGKGLLQAPVSGHCT